MANAICQTPRYVESSTSVSELLPHTEPTEHWVTTTYLARSYTPTQMLKPSSSDITFLPSANTSIHSTDATSIEWELLPLTLRKNYAKEHTFEILILSKKIPNFVMKKIDKSYIISNSKRCTLRLIGTYQC